MNEVFIDKVQANHARYLISQMKEGGLTDEDNRKLDACLGPASDIWVGFIDKVPVCAWGLVPPTMLSDRAYLWLYASPLVDDYKFLFVRYSQRVVEGLRTYYPTIYGVCDVENDRAIRWLKWLGGKFTEPYEGQVPFTIGGR